MSKEEWQALYRSLDIWIPDFAEPLGTPPVETLNEFETTNNLRLPPSYREFISVFGPGQFTRGYRVRSPGFIEGGEPVDLQCLYDRFAALKTDEDYFQHAYTDHKEQVRRLVHFADDGGGTSIAWDPHDRRDTNQREYAIYGMSTGDVIEIAASFPEFIYDVCLKEDPLWDEEELGPLRGFEPATRIRDDAV